MGMLIDGPITSQTIDSSGEILHLKGLDITDFKEGKAFLNFEHNNDMAENILGKFIYAKKIFTKSDCENDRQKAFWDQLQVPFLYGVCELFDDEGHPGAVAAAAMLRYFKKRNEKIMIGFSIEGQTLERNDGDLLRTIGRRTAWTLRPCNRTCWVDMLSDSGMDIKKYENGFGVLEGRTVEVDSAILDDTFVSDPVDQVRKALQNLKKTLTAGVGNVAPSGLTGGAALGREHLATPKIKNKLKAALRDWNRVRPLKEVVKAVMPEVSDEYVDHFVELARDLALKKGVNPNLVRIGAEHAIHGTDEDQAKLVEGLYWDESKYHDPGHQEMGSKVFKLQNDAGHPVFAKIDWSAEPEAQNEHEHSQPHKAPAYYKLAKDYFNMGQHVPVSVAIKHPKVAKGMPIQVQSFLKDMKTPYTHNKDWRELATKSRQDGSLHKLALMDMVMGNRDRHPGNIVMHDNRIYHVDNDQSFENSGDAPFYATASAERGGVARDLLHQDASKWLQSLDPKKLVSMASAHGIIKPEIEGMVKRLRLLQEGDKKGQNIGSMAKAIAGAAK